MKVVPDRWPAINAVKIVFCNFNNGVYRYALGDPLAVGGAERQQWFLARALVAAGWSVIVAVQEIPELASGTVIEGVRFVSYTGSETSSTASHRLVCLFRFLRSELPDWLYWRTADHLLGPAVEIARLAGVKTIFSAAFDTDVQPRHALSRRPQWWPLYAWGLERSDRIVVQHEGQLYSLPSRWRSKALTVPSIAPRSNGMKPHCERQQYVAWVGVMRKPKRPDLLVEIARNAPDLHFVVCGGPSTHRSGPGYGDEILQAIHSLPNIDYRGQVSPNEARQVIADAAVYLCTSDEEGFPNTFLEAWSSGTPVLSLKIDPDRVLQRKKLGLVSNDLETATADLRAIISSPKYREEFAVRCRQHVAEAHSEAKVMAALRSALEVGSCV